MLIDETQTKVTKSKPKTHVYMILDSSGSMSLIKDQAISHFNEQIQDLKSRSSEHDIDVSLVTFNADVSIKRRNQPVGKVETLSNVEYQPSGSTALYDAIGYGIEDVKKYSKDLGQPNTAVLFLIITDGHENSSQEYNQANIKAQIESLQKNGWTFTFMAANVNPMDIVYDFGVHVNNVASYNATPDGMRRATCRSVSASNGYFTARSAGELNVDNFYEGLKDEDSVNNTKRDSK